MAPQGAPGMPGAYHHAQVHPVSRYDQVRHPPGGRESSMSHGRMSQASQYTAAPTPMLLLRAEVEGTAYVHGGCGCSCGCVAVAVAVVV